MAFDFDYDEVQSKCVNLRSFYQDMTHIVKSFSDILDLYGEKIDDKIMLANREVLERISEDMNSINEYITKFTGDKQEAARVLEEIENDIEKEVYRIGK